MQDTQTFDRPATGVYSGQADLKKPGQDFVHYLKEYARERPDVAALWCLGAGFILGWKLKPW